MYTPKPLEASIGRWDHHYFIHVEGTKQGPVYRYAGPPSTVWWCNRKYYGVLLTPPACPATRAQRPPERCSHAVRNRVYVAGLTAA